jgi:hypothetical protein
VLLSTPVHNRGRCYESATWKSLKIRHHILSKVHCPLEKYNSSGFTMTCLCLLLAAAAV